MIESIRINSNSLGSLVLGVLSIMIPIFGIVLGGAGIYFYVKAKKEMVMTNESGKGFALTGLICSFVGIVVQIVTILSLILFASVLSNGFVLG